MTPTGAIAPGYNPRIVALPLDVFAQSYLSTGNACGTIFNPRTSAAVRRLHALSVFEGAQARSGSLIPPARPNGISQRTNDDVEEYRQHRMGHSRVQSPSPLNMSSTPIRPPATPHLEVTSSGLPNSSYTDMRFGVIEAPRPPDENPPNGSKAESIIPSDSCPPLPYKLQLLLSEIRGPEPADKAPSEHKPPETGFYQHTGICEGNRAEYPAECSEGIWLPGCEYRAKAIHVGHLLSRGGYRNPVGVYAVRSLHDRSIEFRMARDGSSVSEILDGQRVQHFNCIQLNWPFAGMSEGQVQCWARLLTAMVPGINDSIMIWE
ncbi:hypothetical protein F5Y15DRAFT_415032 [Xylariaceae sp. FL0016]|nr:hypothetical protein F5Y15DRAFT_415032 [Xylariaceae sp. FL0016]